MKKCEKCQIKVGEDSNFCPICGGKLTVSDENGERIFTETQPETEKNEVGGFDGIINMSFDEKLKGIFMRKEMKTALLFMLIYIAYFIVICISHPVMLITGIVPAAVTVCIFYPASRLKKESFKTAAHTSAVILYAVFIAYMCVFAVAIVGVGICGAFLALGGNIPWNIAFIYSALGTVSFEIGIGIIVSAVFSAAIMLPYFISLIKIAKSLKNGLEGGEHMKISGAGVFKIYTYIGTIFTVLMSAATIISGDYSVIFVLLWNAAQIILANALCDFDKVLKL